MAGIKCRPRLVDFLRQYLLVKDVRSVGHAESARGLAFSQPRCFWQAARSGRIFCTPQLPDSAGYTKEPLAPRTSSADAPQGQPQRFAVGRDISAEWWTLFRSPALNSLVQQSLNNNPSLQTAMANLRAARQAVYAQEGKFFPTVNANFNPTNQLTAGSMTPVLNSGANPFALYTAQVGVSYTFDVWGLNRRTVEALKAQADNQRFQVEAAYLTLSASVVIAAITEASLRGQIEATNELIATNTKMLDILRRQLNSGYANRSDVAAQEAALAQARATLPPLRKALAAAARFVGRAGRYLSERRAAANIPARRPAPADRSARQPAFAADRTAAGHSRGTRSNCTRRARRSASRSPIFFRISPSMAISAT